MFTQTIMMHHIVNNLWLGSHEVLKILDKVLDGTPKVQVSDVISSTIHKPTAVAA